MAGVGWGGVSMVTDDRKGEEIRTGLVDVGAAREEEVNHSVAVFDAGGDHEGGPAAVILERGLLV